MADFDLIQLRTGSPLAAQIHPSGAVFALRHSETLINQLLPGPAEDGLFRLLVRWRDESGVAGWSRLVGPGLSFRNAGEGAAEWRTETTSGLHCTTVLRLHHTQAAWVWQVRLHNAAAMPCSVDVLQAQDLGLADEGAVRNNEAYASHYIDLLPVQDAELGWVILARQNQSMAGNRHPWLALGCATGAEAYCTDGWQFFGADHRLTGEPAAVRMPTLPCRRLQYEFALGGLQSRRLQLAPGASGKITFIARFLADHPAASSQADVGLLRKLLLPGGNGFQPSATSLAQARMPAPQPPPSLFVTAPWIHGDQPAESDWSAWFPGERRHEERDAAGRLLSFFHGEGIHVVAREKEASIARPHGHILRSGETCWIGAGQFGLTCYAAGIFAAQAYLGNPGLARLLPVVRNALNVVRGGGQRVFVRRGGEWRQLGIPSAFVMAPGEVRWIYKFGPEILEARVWCTLTRAASFLDLRVTAGPPGEFLITHQLALAAAEFESGGEVEADAKAAWISCRPGAESLMGRHMPGASFAIAAAEPRHAAAIGGDELLYPDGIGRAGPYVALRTRPITTCGVIMLGCQDGIEVLTRAVAEARVEFSAGRRPSQPPAAPVRLVHPADPGVARIDEILPWFAHNAAIHFSAPHGLEQYGGGAWGVRDVCQGSVEWLLAAGDFGTVRRLLETVFAQQYPDNGNWPQWFMHPPFRSIQQAHCHGDVCLWPVKALCDYVEASNDIAFMSTRAGYTDPRTFQPTGSREMLWEHCDRVIAHCRSRFVAGTALIDYGDGDWDDTLQPVDPAMRKRMISTWTVGLAFHTFRQLAVICRRAGEASRASQLDALCGEIRRDFAGRLMPAGVVAGFMVMEPGNGGSARPLLHPDDTITHIRYRLLPMTRSILAELFTPDEARRHLQIIARELRFPDGVRLMSEPVAYHGGCERIFRRAETAANVGREIGLQYVHAHLRYAEALAKVGDAEELWTALQVVNPVGLVHVLPQAALRQSNVYFSSSDADFADRYEAAARWPELRTGRIAVRGGWRLYSSGPGLFLHKVRACLLGVRESFGDIVFDPVLPPCLDGLVASATVCGHRVELLYRVRQGCFAPRAVTVNGVRCGADRREPNPYRSGGIVIPQAELGTLFRSGGNIIEIEL